MDATGTPVSSIMTWAQTEGKRTGLVTTTRVTHATPAALYAHTPNRNWECNTEEGRCADIARQLIENEPGNRMNVILAGGESTMGLGTDRYRPDPRLNGSAENVCSRTDDRRLVDEWMTIAAHEPDRTRVFVRNLTELMAIDAATTGHLLGLFATNHLTYEGLRDAADDQPSLAQMTRSALQVLQSSNSNGFVLMIEGGRIDQAHHQNMARLALEELIAMDKAIGVAIEMTSRTDTLLLVTADHSHSMTMNGYPERGNDILGMANKKMVEPYETISYANGPGFWRHRAEDTSAADRIRSNGGTWLKLDERTDRQIPTYQHQAMLPMADETHGGEDVPVYALGPGARLVRGSFEQNYIAYVMSYAGCVGPVKHLNPRCTTDDDDNIVKSSINIQGSSSSAPTILPLTFWLFIISILITLCSR